MMATRTTFAATYAAILEDAARADPAEYGLTVPPTVTDDDWRAYAATVTARMIAGLDRGSASITQSPALRKAARRCGMPDTQAAFYAAWRSLPMG